MDLYRLCALYLRRPVAAGFDGTDYTMTFVPPLSVAEQATFDDLKAMSGAFVLTVTLAEWQSVKTDAVGLRAYLQVATRTAAQTAAATKAIIRVLAVIVRS